MIQFTFFKQVLQGFFNNVNTVRTEDICFYRRSWSFLTLFNTSSNKRTNLNWSIRPASRYCYIMFNSFLCSYVAEFLTLSNLYFIEADDIIGIICMFDFTIVICLFLEPTKVGPFHNKSLFGTIWFWEERIDLSLWFMWAYPWPIYYLSGLRCNTVKWGFYFLNRSSLYWIIYFDLSKLVS